MSRRLDRRQAVATFMQGLCVATGGLALAGCAGVKPGALATTGSIKPPAPAAAGKPPASPSASPVKVALLLPLSAPPPTAAIARSMRQAAELALFERNAAELQLIVKDDKGTEAGARAAAEAALSEGAELIIGPYFSKCVLAIAAVAKQSGVAVVAFSNNPATAGSGVYLLGYTAAAEIDRVISYAAAKGRRRFAALLPDDAEGRVLEPAFRAAVTQSGGSLALIERYSPAGNGLVDPARRLQDAIKAAASGPAAIDALFFPGDPETLPQLDVLMPQLEIDAQKVKLLGTSGWDYPSVHTLSQLSGAWFATPDPGSWREFSERFGRSYGAMPVRLASLSHDAVAMAATLAVMPKGARFTPPSLTRSAGFTGADGAFRLKPSGLVDRSLAVMELRASGPAVIDAAAAVASGPTPQSTGKPAAVAKSASLN